MKSTYDAKSINATLRGLTGKRLNAIPRVVTQGNKELSNTPMWYLVHPCHNAEPTALWVSKGGSGAIEEVFVNRIEETEEGKQILLCRTRYYSLEPQFTLTYNPNNI